MAHGKVPPYSAKRCRPLQRTLTHMFDALNCMENKHTAPGEFQLSACDALRSVEELKGYLLEAYISYELKQLLEEKEGNQAAKIATQAMRVASRSLKSYVRPENFSAVVRKGGFVYFGISDGSGTCFGTDFRDLEPCEIPTGYRLSSDNVDSPAIQLIFLSGLAAITEWGRKQLVLKSQGA